MSDDAYGATVAKRRLSRRLAELRADTGYTANHVSDILNWGRGKVGRFEANQWKRPEMSDIRDLVRICGIDGAHVVDRTAFARFLADVQGALRHLGAPLSQ
jgi:Helix-turn-helix domain